MCDQGVTAGAAVAADLAASGSLQHVCTIAPGQLASIKTALSISRFQLS